MSKIYDIYIFTTSSAEYSMEIVNILDPDACYIDGIISRNDCLRSENGKYLKDLRIIKNRDIKDVVLVDNSSMNFGGTYQNAVFYYFLINKIPILQFIDDQEDDQLLYLQDFLKEIAEYVDVREPIDKKFNLKRLVKELEYIL